MQTINFFAPINQDSINGLINGIANANDDILIKFASGGGDVNVAFRMYHYLRTLNRKIIIQNVGDVASSAIIIFLAADVRLACSYSIFAIHRLACELQGGTSLNMLLEREKSLQLDIERYNNIFIDRTAIAPRSIDILPTLKGGREILLTANDALAAGIVTDIADS